MPFRSFLLLCVLTALCAASPADAAPCPEHFAAGRPPEPRDPKRAAGLRELCFSAFAVGHSGKSRTPLWSAEHLTRDGIKAAQTLPRQGTFHAEPALPHGEAADLRDYRASGYDRGHMSPSGDMPTLEAQQESFSLANMVPQAPKLNRNLWEAIEKSVRVWAVRAGNVYVVTGPLFEGQSLEALNGRVLVPTSLFKAVYDPAGKRAGAYLTRNADDAGYKAISIDQLTALAGMDVFPAAPAALKARAGALPPPIRRGASGTRSPRAARDGGHTGDRSGWGHWFRTLGREFPR